MIVKGLFENHMIMGHVAFLSFLFISSILYIFLHFKHLIFKYPPLFFLMQPAHLNSSPTFFNIFQKMTVLPIEPNFRQNGLGLRNAVHYQNYAELTSNKFSRHLFRTLDLPFLNFSSPAKFTEPNSGK